MDVESTFTKVYSEGWWGDGNDFDSGEGSEFQHLLDPYIKLVSEFIQDHEVTSIVDLGCGDFRVGRSILAATPQVNYVGVDVVRPLVIRNQRRFEDSKTKFVHGNLLSDRLPGGELALVRQVLQHLSNSEIATILPRLRRYKYVLITEHVASGDGRIFNRDKSHGPDVRVQRGSGVFVDEPPFSLTAPTVLETPYAVGQVLRTSLLENAEVDD